MTALEVNHRLDLITIDDQAVVMREHMWRYRFHFLSLLVYLTGIAFLQTDKIEIYDKLHFKTLNFLTGADFQEVNVMLSGNHGNYQASQISLQYSS